MIIDPRGFDNVIQWADFMVPLFERRSENFPRLDNEDEWQQWAATVFGDVDPVGQDAPDPYTYDNWRAWAQRLFATTNFEG
jgi:hypothetical protein